LRLEERGETAELHTSPAVALQDRAIGQGRERDTAPRGLLDLEQHAAGTDHDVIGRAAVDLLIEDGLARRVAHPEPAGARPVEGERLVVELRMGRRLQGQRNAARRERKSQQSSELHGRSPAVGRQGWRHLHQSII